MVACSRALRAGLSGFEMEFLLLFHVSHPTLSFLLFSFSLVNRTALNDGTKIWCSGTGVFLLSELFSWMDGWMGLIDPDYVAVRWIQRAMGLRGWMRMGSGEMDF